MGWTGFLAVYLLGGLTFLPLVVAVVLLHAYFTLPHRPDLAIKVLSSLSPSSSSSPSDIVQPGDDLSALDAARKNNQAPPGSEQVKGDYDNNDDDDAAVPESDSDNDHDDDSSDTKRPSSSWSSQQPDTATGYFAVCREYTPMGINAKPIERSTPAGQTTVVAQPSQSVYQSMYRSIFERNKPAQGPADRASGGGGGATRPKKGGNNIFFVVLR